MKGKHKMPNGYKSLLGKKEVDAFVEMQVDSLLNPKTSDRILWRAVNMGGMYRWDNYSEESISNARQDIIDLVKKCLVKVYDND
jgi:hypothetical protein